MTALRLLCLLLLILPSAASAEALPIPEDMQPAVTRAEQLGMAIYRHDRAAAVATDALPRRRGTRRAPEVRGWVTAEGPEGITVTFIAPDDTGTPMAVYRVAVEHTGRAPGRARALQPAEPLNAEELAMYRARSLAASSGFQACSGHYNSVVLPDADEDGPIWAVYLLPGTTRRVIPAGGNYRFEISADGERLLRQRPFSRACIDLDNDPKAAAMMLTHLLDPLPTEIHVFVSLFADKPLYIGIADNRSLWAVESGKLRLVREPQVPQ